MPNLHNEKEFLNFKKDIENDLKVGLTNKVINILLDEIKQYAEHQGVYYLLGLAYFQVKDFSKAIQYLSQAIYFDETNADYYGLAAASYFEMDDYAQARTFAEKAIERDSEHIDALLTLSNLERMDHRYQEAESYLQVILTKDPHHYQALRQLSKCYMDSGEDADKVIKAMKKAKKYGTDEELEFDILKTLYMHERYDECVKQCRKVMMKDPNSYAAQKARELVAKIKQRETAPKAEVHRKEAAPNTATLEEALGKLDELIGLDSVKNEVQRIVKLVQFEKNRAEVLGISNQNKQSYHFMFLGNPGTGKTTVARLIGDIFFHLGLLEKGHLVEADRSTIVGQFIGQTAQLTQEAIQKAMGGVLFIDEAYSLARGGVGSNDFGPEALDTLIKAMEDSRDQMTVILAGYTAEMRELMKMNPGLKSRVNLNILFEDYNDPELLLIANKMASENHYHLSSEGEQAFLEKINREKADESFSNARTARNIIEAAIREKAFRIGNTTVSKAELSNLEPEDFGVDLNMNIGQKVEVLFEELDNMVGLAEVKDVLKKLISYVQFQQKRKEMGIQEQGISLNMAFVGNPGTGKTTVARIVAKILNAIGVLKKGHMVEVTRDDLVGQHIGQTGPKTLDKIKEAYGGVLFIDEAYSLNGSGQGDFGREAIATLIKEMEDKRDKLVVIMAGYTDEMKDLLDVNPGLASRVGYTVEFTDYNPDELIIIFEDLCKQENYTLTTEAKAKMCSVFEKMHSERDRNFGNGRLARKLFESIKMHQAQRVISAGVEGDDMFKITEQDIDI